MTEMNETANDNNNEPIDDDDEQTDDDDEQVDDDDEQVDDYDEQVDDYDEPIDDDDEQTDDDDEQVDDYDEQTDDDDEQVDDYDEQVDDYDEQLMDEEREMKIEEKLDRIRYLDSKYGRKLRNFLSDKKDTPLDVILENYRGRLEEGSSSVWTNYELDKIIRKFDRTQNFINHYTQYEEWDDWKAWHKSILGQCLNLHEMYPSHFGRMLDDFLTPIDARIIFEYSGTEDLRNFRRGGEEASQSKLFQNWLEVIYRYKNSYFCSYLFQVIEPWLITAKEVLNNTLSHIIPPFSDVKCPFGRRLRKNMDFLHKPEFHEIRDFLDIKTELPRMDEPQRKRMNIGDSESQVNENVKSPIQVEPTFHITRPFPNKGGFSAMTARKSDQPIVVYN